MSDSLDSEELKSVTSDVNWTVSKSRTGPDQDQQNFENLGPIRTGRSSDLAVPDSDNRVKSFLNN